MEAVVQLLAGCLIVGELTITRTDATNLVGAVGIELSIDLTKSHDFTVLPAANQMNWS
jgi:hypothetical protein